MSLFGFKQEQHESSTGALSGYNSAGLCFWPASESRSQGQQMLHLCTCALKNQPTVRMAERTHMSWWLTSCLFWMWFIWTTEICWNLSHAMPMHGFINSKISYIFWSCSIFPKIIMHRVKARWRAERRDRPLELFSSLQFLGAIWMQGGTEDSNSVRPTYKAF